MALCYTKQLDYYNHIEDDFVLDATSPYTVYPKAARNRAINRAREDIAYQSECKLFLNALERSRLFLPMHSTNQRAL